MLIEILSELIEQVTLFI